MAAEAAQLSVLLLLDLVAGLVFHLSCVCCPRPGANGAGCVVDVTAGTAACCCLGGTRRLLSGCWQYPDLL